MRVWVVLGFSYALLKFVFNLGGRGFIDLSPGVLDELLYVPLLQAACFIALLTWRERHRRSRPAHTFQNDA